MGQNFLNKFSSRFGDKIEFAKRLVSKPKTVGAIAPTSARMAEIMAGEISADLDLPVIELGPGTGVITKAILKRGVAPQNLYAIEFSEEFIPGLRKRFPGVNFIHGDAVDIHKLVDEYNIGICDCVISALPLLNFPVTKRIRLVNAALDIVGPGRPIVQFSYGPRPPVPPRDRHFTVKHLDTVIRNIPPAKIWTYQRSSKLES